ncbi:hypothetical protein Fmac_018616 [Flemingia macrophylla]|uniref:Peptidase A1 domain-containing protein n=1 Tax=Flemingia macrophylla TaxID=520843 RepID=A0ABD1M5G2_9FABA
MGLILLLIVQLTLLSTPSTTTAKPTNGFSVDIFHRDSPVSPFYNPSMNRTEAIIWAAKRSISRSNMLLNLDSAEAPILPCEANYLMRIWLGTPPLEQFVTVDSGSAETWVQCEPCDNCYRQATPIFDLIKSSTYNRLTYGTFSRGGLGTDVLRFGDPNSSNMVSFNNLVFGCGFNNSWKPYEPIQNVTGILGLGNSPLSFVAQLSSQLGQIFSYCLTSYYSPSSGTFRFGNESTQSGNSISTTPMVQKPGNALYYVTLNGISVDEDRVDAKQPSEGNMFVDSGSSVTMLESSLYYAVQNLLLDNIESDPLDQPNPPFRVCYESLENVDVPTLTFHFAGDDLIMMESNFFHFFKSGIACLALEPRDGTSILGSVSQVDYKVEYDLGRKTVSFAPADCTRD